MDTPKNVKKTKPLHWVWTHFTRKDAAAAGKVGKYGDCKYCNTEYSAHVDRMVSHLIKCPKMPTAVKTFVESHQSKPSKRLHFSQDVPDAEPASSSTSLPNSEFSKDEKHQLDFDLSEAFITGHIPHSFVENKAFLRFCAKLGYKPPNRRNISENLIPEVYNSVENCALSIIANAPFVSLTSDGWKDNRNRAIVNTMIHTPVPLLYKSHDTGLNAHTGEYMASLWNESIEAIGPQKFVAIISDHASNMRCAWRLILIDYPWIITSGCKGHMLHLVCNDIIKIPAVKQVFSVCREIAIFFMRRTPHAFLEAAQDFMLGTNIPFELPSNVRWGTNHRLLDAIVRSRAAIINVLMDIRIRSNNGLEKEASRLREKLSDTNIWLKMQEIEPVLRPVSNAIKLVEGDCVKPSRSYEQIMDSISMSLNEVEHMISYEEDVRESIRTILNSRKDFGESPIFYAANLLDPRERGRAYESTKVDAGIQVVIEKVLKNPLFAPYKNQIIQELAEWRSATGIFANPLKRFAWECLANTDIGNNTWWNGFFPETALSKLVLALECIPITSSSNERNWSTRGKVQTPLRNSLSSNLANMETYVSYNLKHMERVEASPTILLEPEPLTEQEEFDFYVIEDDEILNMHEE